MPSVRHPSSFSKYALECSLVFWILRPREEKLFSKSHNYKINDIFFFIFSSMECQVATIKLNIPLTLTLDSRIYWRLLSGRIMETRVNRLGGGMRVFSNSLTLSFSWTFSFSVLAIENSNASPVTLWIGDNFDGNMFRVLMLDRDFPLLPLEVLSKTIFFESLSKEEFCTMKVSSSQNISS